MALILSEDDVRRALPMQEAIAALRDAFATTCDELPRWRGRAPEGTVGVYNLMAASLPAMGWVGLKSYAWVKGGRTRFHVLLYKWETGTLDAVLEADHLGRLRTGAASGLATDLLARPDAHVMACIGAGGQAFTQIEAVSTVRQLQELRIFARRPERAAALAECVRSVIGVESRVAQSAMEAVTGADIVTTITTSSRPVVLGEWLSSGMHINAAGSNVAHHCELDEAAVRRAGRVVVDSRAGAESEAGDLIVPARAGRFDWSRVIELADVVGGGTPGRLSASEITLFESQGLAREDVATAARAVANARRLGLGHELNLQ